jgi:flagellar hook-associated protein 1 FlgK
MFQSVGTFLGIDIGASALTTAQVGEDVVGNNISNASTAGYSEESLDLTYNASDVPWDTSQPIGSGVSAGSITRASDQYLAQQNYTANGDAGNYSAQSTWLTNVEDAFNEPSTSSINTQLATFFNNFTEIQNDPTSTGVLATAVQGGVTLANLVQSTYSSLTTTNQQVVANINNDVGTINGYAQQIAQLNTNIRATMSESDPPNNLLDERDNIVSKLSSLANVNVQTNSDGTINVSIGSTNLVQGTTADTVTVSGLEASGDVTSGDLGGLIASQTTLGNSITQLNNLASQLITQVNALHEAGSSSDGTTGLPFFTGTDAATIGVNATLINDPSELAISAAPTPPATTPAAGDYSNATAIANLANTTLGANAGPLEGTTFSGYYNTMVTQIGAATADASTNLTTATATQKQVANQLDQVTGVDQDTELTSMMKYQNTYEAASKIVATENSMLQTLITNM